MELGHDVVLFLGAGASLPAPSNAPLLAEVRDACAKRAGVDTASWSADDPRRKLLEHVIPEVFLKAVAEAGYELQAPLARAVTGTPGPSGPNAVHEHAARVVASGGMVWTTNWDCWVETAYERLGAAPIGAAVYGADPPPTGSGIGKLHGSSDRPDTLRFASPDVILPLDGAWHERLVDSCRGRMLFVVGYGGADVDLYPALCKAIDVASATYWFEGVAGGPPFERHPNASYEMWRFRLDGRTDDPHQLAQTGRWLVWCGPGGASPSPSRALLDAFGAPGDVGTVPAWSARFAQVDARVSTARRRRRTLAENLFLRAVISERLAAWGWAATRHLLVVAVASPALKRKSFRALGNLVLLRSHPVRSVLNRAYKRVLGSTRTGQFYDLQAGGLRHNAVRARAVAENAIEPNVDEALNLAMSGRWTDDPTVSETIARKQLTRSLAADLSSRVRDWPERISRSSYELGQALVWQGRYFEADDVCRSAHMRVSGAKWAAWEYAIRSVVRFVHGEYDDADAH